MNTKGSLDTDTRSIILQFLDIHDLFNACLTDTIALQLCSQKYFWSLYFEKHHLHIIKENYNKPILWINLFKNYTKINKNITDRLQFLEGHIKVVDFDNRCHCNITAKERIFDTDSSIIRMLFPEKSNQIIDDFMIQYGNNFILEFIIFYRKGYYLQLEGWYHDANLSFSDNMYLMWQTKKTQVYMIDKNMAYEYMFTLFNHGLRFYNI